MITAVDVGATKVLVAQFGASGRPMGTTRFPTPQKAHDFLEQLFEHLDNLDDISTVVMGVPGIVNTDGVLVRCGNLPWKNVAIKQLLQQRYNVPVHIENDAKLAALAEITSLPTVPHLGVYITVSTGIGGGIIINGAIPPSLRNSEPGHMRLNYAGEWLKWQEFASGTALVKHFGKEAHDFTRETEWAEVAERLSRGLCALIPTLQPDVIVFGGGVGNYFEHFDDLLEEKLAVLEPYTKIPKLRKARHANEAVLYGCHHYAITQLTS
jgi:predicted NBD/HSP70 family sugar kinase